MRSIIPTTSISWIFYICDLRSEYKKSWPSHVKLMGKISLFRNGTFPFTRNGVALRHQWWPRCQFSSVTPKRPSEVTNRFLAITFDSEEIETWEWFHCVSLIKTHRYISNMTYLGHYVTLNWGQMLTLTIQGHHVYLTMRVDETNTMLPKSSLFNWKQSRYRRKSNLIKCGHFQLHDFCRSKTWPAPLFKETAPF